MDAKPAADSRSQLVRWMGVLDANTAGNVHVFNGLPDPAAGHGWLMLNVAR